MTASGGKFWRDPGFYLACSFLVFMVVLIALTFSYPPKARIFPLIVGFSILPLIVIDVLARVFPAINRAMNALQGRKTFEGVKTDEDQAKITAGADGELRRLLQLFFWFSGCFILFFLFGYLISITLFLFFFLVFYSSCSVIRALEITAAVSLTLYAVFSRALDIPWYWQ